MVNLSSGMNDFDVFIMLLNNINLYIDKKLLYINKNSLDHCKIEKRACISFPAIYGLTAIDNIYSRVKTRKLPVRSVR